MWLAIRCGHGRKSPCAMVVCTSDSVKTMHVLSIDRKSMSTRAVEFAQSMFPKTDCLIHTNIRVLKSVERVKLCPPSHPIMRRAQAAADACFAREFPTFNTKSPRQVNRKSSRDTRGFSTVNSGAGIVHGLPPGRIIQFLVDEPAIVDNHPPEFCRDSFLECRK